MLRLVFTFTIFLNSALLFVVEPMIGKYLLPKFGGSPLVWNVAMLFFQATLLLGYLYAHVGTKRVKSPLLAGFHVLLLAGGVLLGWNMLSTHPQFTGAPIVKLLLTLGAIVGLIFFGLAAGSSLIQRLFSQTRDPHAGDPYFLYAASNIGSLLALLSYPLLLEPQFTLTEQAQMFSIGVGVLLALLLLCAILSVKYRGTPETNKAPEERPTQLTNRMRLKWVALTAAPSALLLGVTVYLTTDISPIPLLWVVPLALYLLTFAIAFARRTLPHIFVRVALPIFLFPALVAYGFDINAPTLLLTPFHLIAFFFLVMACHQQVAQSRPDASHLTEYFLWISIGGVLGGLFSAIVAPLVFTGLYEYPLAIIGCCAFYAIVIDKKKWNVWVGLIPFLTLVGVSILRAKNLDPHFKGIWMYVACAGILLSGLRPRQLALAVAAVLVGIFLSAPFLQDRVIYSVRSFYGTRKITQDGTYHDLVNGTTLHGVEEMTVDKDVPLSYYNDQSGVGLVLVQFGDTPRMNRFAVVGLGSGTLAAYGRQGQQIDYYELDPTVVAIAKNPNYFTFLTDCKAKTNVILGDARLSLEQAPAGSYGLIALDAFTSDAIPVHLLTSEAFDDYLRVLRPDGILAVHVSNNYLDLDPVVAAAAAQHHLVAYTGTYWETERDTFHGIDTSEWIVVAHSKKDLQPVVDDDSFWTPLKPKPGFRTWTDEYSNLLTVMKIFSRDEKS